MIGPRVTPMVYKLYQMTVLRSSSASSSVKGAPSDVPQRGHTGVPSVSIALHLGHQSGMAVLLFWFVNGFGHITYKLWQILVSKHLSDSDYFTGVKPVMIDIS